MGLEGLEEGRGFGEGVWGGGLGRGFGEVRRRGGVREKVREGVGERVWSWTNRPLSCEGIQNRLFHLGLLPIYCDAEVDLDK